MSTDLKNDELYSTWKTYVPATLAIGASLVMLLARVQIGDSFMSDGALMMIALACYVLAALFQLTNLYAPSSMARIWSSVGIAVMPNRGLAIRAALAFFQWAELAASSSDLGKDAVVSGASAGAVPIKASTSRGPIRCPTGQASLCAVTASGWQLRYCWRWYGWGP